MKLSQKYAIFFPMFLQISYWGMMKVALPVLPDLHTKPDASERMIHLMVSLSFIFAGLSAIVWGPIIDKFKLRLFILTTVILIIAMLITATSLNYFWTFAPFYISSCVLATSFSVYSRSFPLLYLSDANLIKKSLSLRLLGGFSAAFIAPFTGGMLSEHYGWRFTFVSIILWLLILLIIAYLISDDAVVKPETGKFSENIKQTLLHLKNSVFRRYMVVLGCCNAITQSYVVSIPFWLDRAYPDISADIMAFYLLPLLLPGVLIPLFFSYLNKIGEKKLIYGYVAMFFLSGILPFFLILIKSPPAWIWLLPGVLTNISTVGLSPILTYDALCAIKSHRSTASGLLSTVSYLFGGCAMYITLYIKLNVFYLEGVFILSGALIMSLMLFLNRSYINISSLKS